MSFFFALARGEGEGGRRRDMRGVDAGMGWEGKGREGKRSKG